MHNMAREHRVVALGADGDVGEVRDARGLGGELRYIPALNASDDHVSFLSRLLEKNVAGWPEASLDRSETAVAEERARSRRRALDLGAGR
jgi:hypothetical protein